MRLVGGLPHRGQLVGAPTCEARVRHLTVTRGDDGAPLDLWDGNGDGLVVAAFGVGHVPERLVEGLAKLASRSPVALASRIGNGPSCPTRTASPAPRRTSSAEGSSALET